MKLKLYVPKYLFCLGVFVVLTLCSLSFGVSTASAQEGDFCGGIAGIPCPEGFICVDDPNDGCDPAAGDPDCNGICQAQVACQNETGAAWGLCNAYCEAMECDTVNPTASPEACSRVLDRFLKVTGHLPSC